MEFQEHEIISLVMGLAVFCILLRSLDAFKQVTGFHFLFAAFLASLCSWAFSLLDHITNLLYMNAFEHLAQAIASILLTLWLWRFTQHEKEAASHGNHIS